MKTWLRDFFTFSSLERKGVAVLTGMILIITGLNAYLVHHRPVQYLRDQDPLVQELQRFEQQLIRVSDSAGIREDVAAGMPDLPPVYFYFDPNDASAEELRRLGISSRVIRTLLNYRNHGGRFTKREDLKRIYGMDSQVYKQLLPYVRIRKSRDFQAQSGTTRPPADALININIADSSDLEKLPGIGPVLARRIVRYRLLLGGYYSIAQLREVYGISDSLYRAICPLLVTDTVTINRINLNTAVEYELARHPYIGRHTARGIIRYRSQVTRIRSLQELNRNGIMSGENLVRLEKYLCI